MVCYLEFDPIYSLLICFMWPITLNVYPATFETHLTTNILLCAYIRDVLYFVFLVFIFFISRSFLLFYYLFHLLPPFLSCRHLYFFFCILLIYLVIYLFLLFTYLNFLIICLVVLFPTPTTQLGLTTHAILPFFSFHFLLVFLRYLFPFYF